MRRLRTIAAMLCLAGCVGVLALWARRGFRADVLAFCTPAGHWQAAGSTREGLVVFISAIPAGPDWGGTIRTISVPKADVEPARQAVFDAANIRSAFAGFKLAGGTFTLGTQAPGYHYHALLAPHWAVALPLAAPPLIWLRRRLRRRRRVKEGRCRQCGYDLRGSPQRCPECGVAPFATGDPSTDLDAGGTVPANRREIEKLWGRLRDKFARGRSGGAAMYLKVMLTLLVILELAAAAVMWDLARPDPAVGRYTADELAAGLHRRVGEIRFKNAPLDETIATLARQTDTTIDVDWDTLEEAGVARDRGVSLWLRDVPLAVALTEVVGDDAIVQPALDRVVVAGQVIAYDLEAPRAVFRGHDLRELFATSDPPFGDAPGVSLVDLLMTSVIPHVFDGSNTGHVSYSSGFLFVIETPERQRDIGILLERMRRAMREAPENEAGS